MLAGDFDLPRIEIGVEDFFLVVGGLGEDAAEGVGNEAAAPELETGVGADGVVARHAEDFVGGGRDAVQFSMEENVAEFMTDAVDGADKNAVGDGMGALYGLPGTVLALAEFGFFGRVPADGGGKEESFGAFESRDAGGFGVPLIPADEGTDWAGAGGLGLEVEVAGGEVKLFVEEGIVGNVHFAVEAGDAIGPVAGEIEDGGGVVVEAGRAALKKAGDEDELHFGDHGGERMGGGAGDGLGEVEEGVVFALAEVLGAKKLGQADKGCAVFPGFADAGEGFREIGGRVRLAGHLDQGDTGEFRHEGFPRG